MDAMLSEFDYFTPAVVQSAVESEYSEVFAPKNSASGVTGSTLDFEIPGAANLYRDLSNSYLFLQCKVTTGTGGDLPNDAVVAPANLLLHSLFSNVNVTLCGKDVTDKDSLYAYRAYLETLLTYNSDVLNTRARAEGWCKDDGDRMNNITIAEAANQPAPNSGFMTRRAMISTSKVIELVGRPHVDLFHQNLDIPPQCNMHIKFTFNPNTFVLMAAQNSTFKVHVMAARMYIRTKKVSPDLILAHREMLNKTNFRLPHTQVTIRKSLLAAGSSSSTVAFPFPTRMPKRVVVGFVTNAASSGAYHLNPFNFQNFGITDLSLTWNGQKIPSDGLSMSYPDGQYYRAYLNTLEALGLDTDNRAIALAPQDWKQGYNLYAFKIAPGPIDNTIHTASTSGAGTLTLDVKFAAALGEAVDVLMYCETPGTLEIDKLGNVLQL
jgi:hypothetical protein